MKRKIPKALFLVLICLIFGSVLVACSYGGQVALNKSTLQLEIGKNEKLQIVTGNGNVTWSSSAEEFATVSSDGTVTAVAVGEATITAEIGNSSATCVVTVVTSALYEAKVAAKEALDEIISEMDEADYDAADWTTILQAVSTGKTDIDAANTTGAVASIKGSVIEAIGDVYLLVDKDAAGNFRTTHTDVLDLTTGTVAISDKTDVESALSDYESLDTAVKELLSSEKSLLDGLSAKITALEGMLAIKNYLTDLWNIINSFGTSTSGSYINLSTTSKANIEMVYDIGIVAIDNAADIEGALIIRDMIYINMKNQISSSSAINITILKAKVDSIELVMNQLKLLNETDYNADDWAELNTALTTDYATIRNAGSEAATYAARDIALARLTALETIEEKA